jgi:hypothetical protein
MGLVNISSHKYKIQLIKHLSHIHHLVALNYLFDLLEYSEGETPCSFLNEVEK